MRQVEWFPVGKGRLALWPRPKMSSIAQLTAIGCTHLVTLLSEAEGALKIDQRARSCGLTWVWLPLPNGTPPEGEAAERLAEGIRHLGRFLGEGAGLLIHCAAGIHRTGMVAYALLRLQGLEHPQTLEALAWMRQEVVPLTAQGLQQKHVDWGERHFGEAAKEQEA